ncbi:MAG: 4a-hydroxytetrahydrobiopterin dehydratase [Myxococcaceae bacterium]|nr:4a-hydroxytetrahydrobiopterin dehydratase [Myxococcaceae bacterium]
MSNRTPLPQADLDAFLSRHPAWRVDAGALVRTYEAPAFLDGVGFVDRVAKLAEAADHHPDIDIRWRKVTLRFITHDAGHRITELDTRLAAECDALFGALRPAV